MIVGPSLADPAASAAAAGATDVATYLRTSILEPEAYTVPGFDDAKAMPTVFGEILRPEQVDAIVDYLLGLADASADTEGALQP